MIQYDAIRLVAILAIVMLHTAANGVNFLPLGSVNWWLANLVDSACRTGVPLFLMLTGALLLNRQGESNSNYYRRRWQRLAIPVVFWTLFYLAWAQFKAIWKDQPFDLINELLNELWGKPYFHLWFIYLLIGLYAALPLLRGYWQRLSHRQQLWLTLGCVLLQQTLLLLRFFHQAVPAMPDWFVNADHLPWPLWFIAYMPYVMLGALLAAAKPVEQNALLPTNVLATTLFPTTPLRTAQQQTAQQTVSGLATQPKTVVKVRFQNNQLLQAILLLCCIAATAIGYAIQRNTFNPEPFFYSYHRLSMPVLLSALLLWQLIRNWHIHSLPLAATTIVTHSFGIYLVHPVWLDICSALLQQPFARPIPYPLQLAAQWLFIVAGSLGTCLGWQKVKEVYLSWRLKTAKMR
jgi:surface polysaccharide O-acyltransferase-like enzyme